MKSILFSKPAGIALAVVLGLSSSVTLAEMNDEVDSTGVKVVAQEQNGITFLNGGISQDESLAIKQAKGYNLHLSFSTGPSGSWVSDVEVEVSTLKGKQVLAVNDAGPLLYAKLPAGKYQVAARGGDGQVLRKIVVVGNGSGRDVHFHWNKDVN